MVELKTAIEEFRRDIDDFVTENDKEVCTTPGEVCILLQRLAEFEKIGLEPDDLLSLLTNLKSSAESIIRNRDSVFDDERSCANSELEDMLDSLNALSFKEDKVNPLTNPSKKETTPKPKNDEYRYITTYSFDSDKSVSKLYSTEKEAWDAAVADAVKEKLTSIAESRSSNKNSATLCINGAALEITLTEDSTLNETSSDVTTWMVICLSDCNTIAAE